MRLTLALLVLLVAPRAWPCPTCVGPRLDERASTVEVRVQSTVGSDAVAGVDRLEWRNEVAGALWLTTLRLELSMPVLTRWTSGERARLGPGDLTFRASKRVFVIERPGSSDVISAQVGLSLPTGDVVPATSPSDWRSQLGTGAISPAVGVAYRHSDQAWAVFGAAAFQVPLRVRGALEWGPSAVLDVGADFEVLEGLRLRALADLKHLWPVRLGGEVASDSAATMLFVGSDVTAHLGPLELAAGFFVPVWCDAQGYQHGNVYRLTLALPL